MNILWTGVLLLLHRACHCQQQFDALKLSNVPFPYSYRPGALINAGYDEAIAEFTFCYRLLLESYNDGPMQMFIAWRNSDINGVDGSYQDNGFFVDSSTIFSGFELDGFQASFNFLRRDIPDGGIANRSWPVWHHEVLPRFIEPGEWFHFCIAYSSILHIMYKYQDGHKAFSFHYPDKVVKPFPPHMFDVLEFGRNIRGTFTDLNIYSSFFTEEDMKAWTTSCNKDKGDILAWTPVTVERIRAENNQNQNVSFFKIDKTEVCPDSSQNAEKQKPIKSSESSEKQNFKPQNKIYETFVGLVLEYIEHNENKDIDEAKDMCFRLNGELMTVPQNEEEEFIMRKIVNDFIMKKVSNNQTYLKENEIKVQWWLAGESEGEEKDIYTSAREQAYAPNGESTYFHPITGVKLNPAKPMTRPNYSTNPKFRKLCMRCYNGLNNEKISDFWWWKNTPHCMPSICSQRDANSVICQFEKEPTFKLRGLCKDALMDTQYKLAEPEPYDLSSPTLYHDYVNLGKHARRFVGPKGWVISRNKTDSKWRMTHYYYTDLMLTMMAKNTLPFGRHKWKIENNVCNEGKTSLETLQLSACPEGWFTCDDGKCLEISQRCNNIEVRI